MLRNAAKKILVRKNLREIWSNFVELKEKLDNEEEKSNSFQYCAAVLEEAEKNKTKVHLWVSEQQKNNVAVEIRPDDSISNVLNQKIKGELRDKFSKWQSKSFCEKGSVRLKQHPFKLGCMNFSSRKWNFSKKSWNRTSSWDSYCRGWTKDIRREWSRRNV